MEYPLVSIIIPVYNAEHSLRRCLDSVITQTYPKIEILLVDDGSTDDSAKICDLYAKKHSEIFAIHTQNQGTGEARNCGLEESHGEYIFFLDSDDNIEKSLIEKMVEEGMKNKADIVAAGVEKIDVVKNCIVQTIVPDKKMCGTGEELLRLHYQNKAKGMMFAYVTGRLLKKTIFKEIRFDKECIYEDISLMPYIMLRAKKVIYLPIIGYHYYLYPKSRSQDSKSYNRYYMDSLKIWDEHLHFFKEKNMDEFERYISLLICEKVVAHGLKKSIPDSYYDISMKKLSRNIIRACGRKVGLCNA